jgi:1-acyl-sn-glycerol-3-phosphate acyltransferase
VVNLVSNDASRFDEALLMWPFLWAGPLELVAVIFMLAAELGWIPALAGAAALLVLVPFQARPIPQIPNHLNCVTVSTTRMVGVVCVRLTVTFVCGF